MARDYALLDLVTLPTMDGATALALGQELLTASRGVKDLPPAVQRAHKRMADAHRELDEARTRRLGAGEAEPAVQRDADLAVDAAWKALQLALEAWARLPVLEGDGRKQQQARELLALLFPQGLTFLQLPFKAEWAESSTRLSRIAADGLGPRLRSLVGEEFLTTLETVHDAYGKALGITAKTTRPPAMPLPSLREPLGAFLDTLRVYVVKVTALEEPDDEESTARVAQLLEPLRTFPARRRGRAPAEEPPDENRDGGDAAG